MTGLRRRRLLAGVAAAGTGLAVHELLRAERAPETPTEAATDRTVTTMAAVLEAVYPWSLDDPAARVRPYLRRLSEERAAATAVTAVELDRASRSAFGVVFASLSVRERRRLLERLGTDRVFSDPAGSLPARIRFHLVNSALYAVMTHPTGTRPFGIGNPTGYPGGFETVRAERDS
jgi:hypothetical protein